MTTYPITPVPKPRQTRADKWKKRESVMRYRAFADEVRLRGLEIDHNSKIVFMLPMPKSWSKAKKERNDGWPHEETPDLDNLVKALFDAVYKNDSHIWRVNAEKRWGNKGSITVL